MSKEYETVVRNPENQKLICGILKIGASRKDAADHLEIDILTIQRECKRSPKFEASLTRAEADGKLRLLGRLGKSAEEEWKAAAWMLERKWWREWSKRTPDQLTPEQFAGAASRLVAGILMVIPRKHHKDVRNKIDEIIASLVNKQVIKTDDR